MEPLNLQQRHTHENAIECWDDDDDLKCVDDIQLCTASTATSVTNSSIRRSGHRDSISSRLSTRSDLDSVPEVDDDWQVLLQEHDDLVTEDTVSSVRNAGVPIPENIPKSALTGGTIKRLGRRKTKGFVDDWSEDVVFPSPDRALELKMPQESEFPDSLRNVDFIATSPVKAPTTSFWDDYIPPRLQPNLPAFGKFRKEDNSTCNEDVPTIKAPKAKSPRGAVVPPPNCSRRNPDNDIGNFGKDFDLPTDDIPLRLPSQTNALEASNPVIEDVDMDWSEGSIGVRFGGTAREYRSNPSSSISILSPSASSFLTGESEDDHLDGLVIPEGPLNLESSLKKRQDAEPPHLVDFPEGHTTDQKPSERDDFFSGLEVGDADVFDSGSGKLAANPNVKYNKTEHPCSPAHRSTTTITFTNAAVSPKSRIPRLSGHERSHSTQLETVSEIGAPISNFRRLQSRLGGHSAQSSFSGLSPFSPSAAAATASTQQGRQFMGAQPSESALNNEHLAASTPLLKTKRSVPSMRHAPQTASTPPFQRSLFRNGGASRSFSSTRSKTPFDRSGNDIRLGRKSPTPFIPAGASRNQSHHINVKAHRHPHPRRTNSDSSVDIQDTIPQIASGGPFGSNNPDGTNPETLIAAAKRSLTRPTRRRNFGDGTELQSFDDLPTSSSAESRFVKHPTGRGLPRSFRGKPSRNQKTPSQTETLTQQTVPSKPQGVTPRFARDTAASRNAREQRVASTAINSKNRETHSNAPLSSSCKIQSMSRLPPNSTPSKSKKEKRTIPSGSRPQLIKPLGSGVNESRAVKGMRYNPETYQWEGNENSVSEFDSAIPKSPKAAPALITNVGAMQNVHVVGEMVFDPQCMCWLKLAPQQPEDNGVAIIRNEDDVFAGLDDLEENIPRSGCSGGQGPSLSDGLGHNTSGDDRSGGESSDEWPITEEFDVGPEFIKRQRAEEEKWKRKVDRWVGFDRGKLGDNWRWAIRDLVKFDSALGNSAI